MSLTLSRLSTYGASRARSSLPTYGASRASSSRRTFGVVGGIAILLCGGVTLASAAPPDSDGSAPPEEVAEPPAYASVALSHSRYPTDGIVLGTASCNYCGSVLDSLVVEDDQGRAVAGRFLPPQVGGEMNSFWWLPDEELSPGTYWVHIENGYGATFEAVEGSDDGLVVQSTLGTQEILYGDPVGCRVTSSTATGLTFHEHVWVSAVVAIDVSGLTSSQYAYSLVLRGRDPRTYGVRAPTLALEGQDEEACFDVWGWKYVDGSQELIHSECRSLAELPLGKVTQPSSNLQATLKLCAEPPEGYWDEWCDVFESAFLTRSCWGFDAEACFAARRSCPTGDNPTLEQEQAERGGTGGDTVASENTDPDTNASDFVKGCALPQSGVGSSALEHWWVILALGLFLRRRTYPVRSSFSARLKKF